MASKQVSSAFRLGSTDKLWGYIYQLDKRKSSDMCLMLKVFLYYYFLRRFIHVINFFFYYARTCAELYLVIDGGVKERRKEKSIWFPRRPEASLKKQIWYPKFRPWTRVFRFRVLSSPTSAGCYQSFFRRKKKYLRRFMRMRFFVQDQKKKIKFFRTRIKVKRKLKRLTFYATQKALYRTAEFCFSAKHHLPTVSRFQRCQKKRTLLRYRKLLFLRQVFQDPFYSSPAQENVTQLVFNKVRKAQLTSLSYVYFRTWTRGCRHNKFIMKQRIFRHRSRFFNSSLLVSKKRTKALTRQQKFLCKFLLQCKRRFGQRQLVHPVKVRKKWLVFNKKCKRQMRFYFFRKLRSLKQRFRNSRAVLRPKFFFSLNTNTKQKRYKKRSLKLYRRSFKRTHIWGRSRKVIKGSLRKKVLFDLPRWRLRFLPFTRRRWVDRQFRALQYKRYAGPTRLIRLNIRNQPTVKPSSGVRSTLRSATRRAQAWHKRMWSTKRTVVQQKLRFYGSPWNKKYLKFMFFRKRRVRGKRKRWIPWQQRRQLRAAKKRLLKRSARSKYFLRNIKVFQKINSAVKNAKSLCFFLNSVQQKNRIITLRRWFRLLKRYNVWSYKDEFNSFKRLQLLNVMKFFDWRRGVNHKLRTGLNNFGFYLRNHTALRINGAVFADSKEGSNVSLIIRQCIQSRFNSFVKIPKRVVLLQNYRKLNWFLISKLIVSSRISRIINFPVWVRINSAFHLVTRSWKDFYKKVARWAHYATFLHKRFKKIVKRLMLILVFSFRFKNFYRFIKILGFLFNRHRRQQRVIRQFFRVIIKKSLFRFKRLIGWQLILRGKMNRRPRARQLTWWRYRKPALQNNTMSVIYAAREVVTDFGAYYFRLWVYYWI